MRLLLDTHIALWAIANSPHLSAKARELVSDEDNEIYVSAASVWEIAIKHPLRRSSAGDFNISASDAVLEFAAAGYALISITAEHGRRVETLPLHHGDPFDRLLIAQALAEPLRLLTHDQVLAHYSDTVLVV
jgi:PIN domain nuclease of toxin-antitoxin system